MTEKINMKKNETNNNILESNTLRSLIISSMNTFQYLEFQYWQYLKSNQHNSKNFDWF